MLFRGKFTTGFLRNKFSAGILRHVSSDFPFMDAHHDFRGREIPKFEFDSSRRKVNTGVLLLHHGSPKTPEEAAEFVTERAYEFYPRVPNILIRIGMEIWLNTGGDKELEKLYSNQFKPLEDIHVKQGKGLVRSLEIVTPELAPAKVYVAHQYSNEFSIENAIRDIYRDAPQRMIVLPQYPQFWCFQTSSILNALGNILQTQSSTLVGNSVFAQQSTREHHDSQSAFAVTPPVSWSLIDRWSAHPALTDGWAKVIEQAIEDQFPPDVHHNVSLLFCAPYMVGEISFRSTSISVLQRGFNGSQYRLEIGASALRIVEALAKPHVYQLAWFNSWTQRQWLPLEGNSVKQGVADLVGQGFPNVLLVPLFTTASDLDSTHLLPQLLNSIALTKMDAHSIKLLRPPDDHPTLMHGLAEIVKNHCIDQSPAPIQFQHRCRGCSSCKCAASRSLFSPRYNQII